MAATTAVKVELSAGCVCSRRGADRSVEVLLIKDSHGNWGFPKGHVEQGEDSRDAALRECREETGLTRMNVVDHLGTIDWYFRFRDALVHKFCDYYLMETDSSDTASPQKDEGIQACRWLSPGAALSQITYSNAEHVLRVALERLSERSEDAPMRSGSAAKSERSARGK